MFENPHSSVIAGAVPRLEHGAYWLIMAVPPWSFRTWSNKGKGKSADQHYSCMTLADVQVLPVAALAAPDCCLFLWATWPLLVEALGVISAWGFEYKSGGAWHKTTRNGVTAFGTGYRVRCASEPFLLAFRGNPKNSRSERNLIVGEIREHSRKPESAYAWCERYLPDARRAELFSRQPREGWETWGNEVVEYE